MTRNTYIEGLAYQLPHPFRRQAEDLAVKFDRDTYKVDGVLRWKSNNLVPPQDCLDFWKHIGKKFNMSKSTAARERDNKAFLKNYSRNQRPVSAEQRNEMIGAFGKGTTVVDVLTGRKTRL